nr:hypothetical protein [Candidatus Sigynarchaeota archaeon]
MSTTRLSCPECGGAAIASTAHGRTCMACGLVVDAGQQYVVSDQRGKDGFIASHAVFHGNTTTLVGARHERVNQANAKLGMIQRRLVTYTDTKRSRVYHFVRGLVDGMQLPEIVVDTAMHLHDKLAGNIPKGAALAGPDLLGGISVFISCKQLGIAIDRTALAKQLDVKTRCFARALMHARAIGKQVAPAMPSVAKATIVIARVLSVLREIAGNGDYQPAVESVYRQVAKVFMGLREDTRVAVAGYLAAQVLGIESASFTMLATKMGVLPSSLYNAVKRVLAKLGIVVVGTLSRTNVAAYFQQPTLLRGGVVNVAPVEAAISKPTPAPVAAPSVPAVHVYAPARVPASIPAPVPASIPVSKPASPVLHAKIERPPSLFYRPVGAKVPLIGELRWRRGRPRVIPENHVVAAVTKAPDLFIVVRRGRSRIVPIPPLPGRLPSPVLACQGLPEPPFELAAAPG